MSSASSSIPESPEISNFVAPIIASTQSTTSPSSPAINNPAAIISTTASTGYYANIASTNQQATLGSALGSGVNAGLLAALPVGFKTSVQQIADFQLGTFLGTKGVVNGSTASLINGVIDFIKSGNSTLSNANAINNIKFNINKKFIPIVIKTEFNLQGTSGGNVGTPLYIVFQSTPDTINFTKGATWNPKEFFGRPEPVQIYASSGAISFSLQGRFFANSATDLQNNLNLEKQLFALVTPSKLHFMPSPVQVTIGNWKTLRCITNSVTIDFQGPWYIPSSVSTGDGNTVTLPSHAPYVYDVTFNFTITSKANTVQYAEDMVDYGFNGGMPQTNPSEITGNGSGVLVNSTSHTLNTSNLYAGLTYTTYDPTTGEISYTVAGQAGQAGTVINTAGYPNSTLYFNTTAYLQSLGLPTTTNNALASAANAQITSGLSAIIQTTINKNAGPQITKVLGS